MRTFNELERQAYISGDIKIAELFAELDALEIERDELATTVDELATTVDELATTVDETDVFTDELREELENLRAFFDDCFECLSAHYTCPSITSDYDRSVIFDAIRKGENTNE